MSNSINFNSDKNGSTSQRNSENFFLAVMVGVITCLFSSLVWAGITVITEYQISYMAIGVGALVGFAIRFTGKGGSLKFGLLGGGLALFGCLFGNLLAQVAFLAQEYSLGYAEVLFSLDWEIIQDLMSYSFDKIDLLFYGVAIVMGYKFSTVGTEEEEDVEVITE